MFRFPKTYDVIVIGAGHAGVEAAMAAARLGAQVAVLTQNLDTIGQMSCNPAIGGLAKGHMVREIDALGGVMGLNTDATGIQWRMLNASKGPSVRAPRAQCDKKAYQFRMKRELEAMPGVEIHQGNVADLLVENDHDHRHRHLARHGNRRKIRHPQRRHLHGWSDARRPPQRKGRPDGGCHLQRLRSPSSASVSRWSVSKLAPPAASTAFHRFLQVRAPGRRHSRPQVQFHGGHPAKGRERPLHPESLG